MSEEQEVKRILPDHYYRHCFEQNGRTAKFEARYWNPGGQNICIIASVMAGIDWAAYIGAYPEARREHDALVYVAAYGAKLSKKDAEYFFPDIALPYRY